MVLCLPHVEEDDVSLLLEAAKTVLAIPHERHYFVVVQQGRGAAAFARTFHREHEKLTTYVIHLSSEKNALQHILAEIKIAGHYHEEFYGADDVRRERILTPLSTVKSSGALPLSAEDVLLVTGGGKGITAECAADLARKTGVRLVLLGRSQPENDSELARNLARFEQLGIVFQYVATDVTDAAAIQSMIAKVSELWGDVTAILHGAGTNHPAMLHQLNEAAFKATLAPKVKGLRLLLNAIKPEKLRLLIGFGSQLSPP